MMRSQDSTDPIERIGIGAKFFILMGSADYLCLTVGNLYIMFLLVYQVRIKVECDSVIINARILERKICE